MKCYLKFSFFWHSLFYLAALVFKFLLLFIHLLIVLIHLHILLIFACSFSKACSFDKNCTVYNCSQLHYKYCQCLHFSAWCSVACISKSSVVKSYLQYIQANVSYTKVLIRTQRIKILKSKSNHCSLKIPPGNSKKNMV